MAANSNVIEQFFRGLILAPERTFQTIEEGFRGIVSVLREPFETAKRIVEITVDGRIQMAQIAADERREMEQLAVEERIQRNNMNLMAEMNRYVPQLMNTLARAGNTEFVYNCEIRGNNVIFSLIMRPLFPLTIQPIQMYQEPSAPLAIGHHAEQQQGFARVLVTFFLFLDDYDVHNLSVVVVGTNGEWDRERGMDRIPNKNAYSRTVELETDIEHQIKYKIRPSEQQWIPTGQPTVTNIRFSIPRDTIHENHALVSYHSLTDRSVQLRHSDNWGNGVELDRVGEGIAPVYVRCVPFTFDRFRFFRGEEWRPEGLAATADFRRDDIIPRMGQRG